MNAGYHGCANAKYKASGEVASVTNLDYVKSISLIRKSTRPHSMPTIVWCLTWRAITAIPETSA